MKSKVIANKEKDYERRNIHKELCEIMDRQKEKIKDFAWDTLKISNVASSRIIARKYKDAGLDK